jgi:hypothetical protein
MSSWTKWPSFAAHTGTIFVFEKKKKKFNITRNTETRKGAHRVGQGW